MNENRSQPDPARGHSHLPGEPCKPEDCTGHPSWDELRADGGPIEPPATQRAAARGLRSMFLSLVAEGFTEPQALVIIGQMLAANAMRGPQ